MNKRLKRILIILASVLGMLILTTGGYLAYLSIQYYRIADFAEIEVKNQQDAILNANAPYTVLTYNIGFGAYNHDFSFFMDSGIMKDGTPVTGVMSRAQSKEIVETNTTGSINTAQNTASDFYFFQEVDEKSTRSFGINQYQILCNVFSSHASSYALNFHSAYLAYPFYEPHGSVISGILTLSPVLVSQSIRRQYPVDNSFPAKYLDLDRCFQMTRVPTDNGKELVLINSHMSAFDKGGLVRENQLALLNSVMTEEYEKGNYVIIGGDFNHDIAGTIRAFSSQQEVPAWVFELSDSKLVDHFSIVRAENADLVPTCRSTDLPYEKGINYSAVLDGFIVSDNIKATAENLDEDFTYSDHNPVKLTFTLNP